MSSALPVAHVPGRQFAVLLHKQHVGVVAVAGRPVVARARVWPGKSTGCVVGPLMVDSFSTSWIAKPRTAALAAEAAQRAASLSGAGSMPV